MDEEHVPGPGEAVFNAVTTGWALLAAALSGLAFVCAITVLILVARIDAPESSWKDVIVKLGWGTTAVSAVLLVVFATVYRSSRA